MYKPETQWIGGVCPVPPEIKPSKRIKPEFPPKVGHKRQSILDMVRSHAPIAASEISYNLQMPLDSVRGQLRILFKLNMVIREERDHPNGYNKIMFYSGVQ